MPDLWFVNARHPTYGVVMMLIRIGSLSCRYMRDEDCNVRLVTLSHLQLSKPIGGGLHVDGVRRN